MSCKRVGDAIVCSRKRDPGMACMVCGAPVIDFDKGRLTGLCGTCSDDSKRDPAFAQWAQRQAGRFG
jgi:hypothetical protein